VNMDVNNQHNFEILKNVEVLKPRRQDQPGF
jgi:hypothetical protein